MEGGLNLIGLGQQAADNQDVIHELSALRNFALERDRPQERMLPETSAVAIALALALLTGCGGGDDQAPLSNLLAPTSVSGLTLTAALIPVGERDDDEGRFRIEFACTDDTGPTVTAATLNGIPVAQGQVVRLEVDDEEEMELEDGVLKIKAPFFELRVTCVDASGNFFTVTATPAFASDDDDDSDDDDSDDDDSDDDDSDDDDSDDDDSDE